MQRARNNVRLTQEDQIEEPDKLDEIWLQGQPHDMIRREIRYYLAELDEQKAVARWPRYNRATRALESTWLSSCDAVDCLWPCEHHNHLEESGMFDWFPTEYEAYTSECQYCALLWGIGKSFCRCSLRSDNGSSHIPHECTRLLIYCKRDFVSHIDMISSCGGMSLELGLAKEAVNDWPYFPVQMAECDVNEDRSSQDALDWCRSCIRTCESQHPNCMKSQVVALPTRIVDCRAEHNVRLINVSDVPDACKYVALSYCWGGAIPLKTKKASLFRHRECIPWAGLPKLFQDAVMLARRLDVPFLWIDSLCIIQDDMEDVEQEIGRMGGIYNSAFLVIIAAASRSPHAGIFEDIDRHWGTSTRSPFVWRTPSTVPYMGFKLDGVKVRERTHTMEFEIDACRRQRIAERAWTFQERQLARRCLIMGSTEMVWECKTACMCECSGDQSSLAPQLRYFPRLLPPVSAGDSSKSPVFESPDAAYKFWHSAVRVFTSRKLGREDDRLPAISAIASLVSQATSDTYLAGLWRNDLINDLMWYKDNSDEIVQPYSSYVAPSWSWASTPARTGYYEVREESQAAVIEAWCTLSGDNPFGKVNDGAIVLNAINCRASMSIWMRSDESLPKFRIVLSNGMVHEGEGSHHGNFSFFDGFYVEAVSRPTEAGESAEFIQRILIPSKDQQCPCSGFVQLVWLSDDVCLILGYSKDSSDTFTRLGILNNVGQAPPIPSFEPSRVRII